MKPLVGVIIPVFNGEQYLTETLESVICQSYRPIDVIVIDDGSTDRSADVIARFGRTVTYSYQVNQGAGAARTRGIRMTGAEVLAFLDQDDLWCRDKLALQMEALQDTPSLDMVFGHVRQFLSPDWRDPARLALYCPETAVPGYLPSALLVRRASFLRAGAFDTRWRVGEWADWYARAVEAGLHSLLLPHVVAWRRLHARNQGLVARAAAPEYARLLKAALDRRRGRDQAPL